METVIFEPFLAVPPVLPPVVPRPIWFGGKEDLVRIQLSSGERLEIRAVHLYNESALQELSIKRASATQQMGGVSTGLGAIGSASWVIGVSAVLSLVESSLSKKAFANGFALFQEVFKEEQKLRESSVVFPVGRIKFVQHPSPGLWRAVEGVEKFIHNGDDFLTVVDDRCCTSAIRWNAVEHLIHETKK